MPHVTFLTVEGEVNRLKLCKQMRQLYENGNVGQIITCSECGRFATLEKVNKLTIAPGPNTIGECPIMRLLFEGGVSV